jgi:hypothetical protein
MCDIGHARLTPPRSFLASVEDDVSDSDRFGEHEPDPESRRLGPPRSLVARSAPPRLIEQASLST